MRSPSRLDSTPTIRGAFLLAALSIACALSQSGCIVSKTVDALMSTPRPVRTLADPTRPDARLAITWIGHATTLVQMDDVFFLTDPVFTRTVGELSARLVAPGLTVESLPRVNVVLISHLHFDHLSLGSLDLIEHKVDRLYVPKGGLVYVPDYPFETDELGWWQSVQLGGMKITAVKVQHNGMRYGIDAGWMKTSYTGYVVQYHGMTVYYAGDTAFNREDFVETARRFPHIDLAILPIGPIQPRSIMKSTHEDPAEAFAAFDLLRAKYMIPIHYGTFINSVDAPHDSQNAFDALVKERHDEARAFRLEIGEQRVLIAASPR